MRVLRLLFGARQAQVLRPWHFVPYLLVRWAVRHNIAAADLILDGLECEHPTVVVDHVRYRKGRLGKAGT